MKKDKTNNVTSTATAIETKFFYALCELFNEGHTAVKVNDSAEFTEIARRVFPSSAICGGAIVEDADGLPEYRFFYID